MAQESIKEIISEEAFAQVKRLKAEMADLVVQLQQNIAHSKALDAALRGAKGFQDLENKLKEAGAAHEQLIKTGDALKQNLAQQAVAERAVITETVNLTKTVKETDAAIQRINSTIDAGAKVLAEQKLALTQNRQEQKDLKKELDAGRISVDQYTEKMIFLIQQENELKVRTAELAQQQKQFAKENIAVVGSMDQAAIRLGRLRDEYRTLTDEEKAAPFGQQLKLAIDGLDPAIKSADASIGNFKRNVGNYAGTFSGAFNVLKEELANIKQQLQDPSLSGKALASLTEQGQLLEQVLNGLSKEFTSSRAESRAFQEAAAKIGLVLEQDSRIFQAFRQEVGKGVDDIKDIKDSIKLAASDTGGLDRLISAAQGITGAFSVAQGAAALFGEENEDLQQTFVKLQAALTILNGLQAVQNELKNKDSIFTKALNFLKVQETKLTVVQTEAQIANTAATNAGAAAATRLGFALKAIGIGVVLTLISGAVYAFEKLAEATDEAGQKQKALNDAYKEAQSSYAKAIQDVSTLRTEVDLAKKGFINKSEVVKHYNETLGKTTGEVKNIDEAEQALGKNADNYLKFTLKKAIATELYKKAAEETARIQQEAAKDQVDAQEAYEEASKNGSKDLIAVFDFTGKETEKAAKKNEKYLESLQNLARQTTIEAATLAKQFGFDFFGDDGKNTGNKAAENAAKKSAKARFDNLKAEAEETIKVYKAIADNENNNYYLRLVGLKKYQEEQKKLIEDEREYLISAAKGNAGEIEKINGDARRKLNALTFETGQQKLAILKKQTDEEKAIAEQLRKEIDGTDDKSKEDKDRQKQTIIQNTEAPYKEIADNNLKEYQRDLENLNKIAREKNYTAEQYQMELEKIDQKYADRKLSNDLSLLEALVGNLKKYGFDVKDLEQRLAETRMLYDNQATDNYIKNNDKRKQSDKELADRKRELNQKIFELGIELEGFLETVVLAGYDKEKNAIQGQIDELDKKKEKDIEVATTQRENIDGTLVTEEQRAARIAVINAKAQAQKETLEARQRKIDQDRARFEKAAALVRVAANTFEKVAAIKAQLAVLLANPLTAFYAPIAAAQIPIAIASGAIAAASILAQPIPKFADGGVMQEDGIAQVSEKGIEKLTLPDGKEYLTPNKPTITFLPKGTVVTPNNELMLQQAKQMALNDAYQQLVNAPSIREEAFNRTYIQALEKEIGELKGEMANVVNAIKSKPVAYITNTWKGVQVSMQDAQGWTEYVNKYIKT